MRRQQGFTLIEIMIAVAIIGLLAAIAIPEFAKARQMTWRNMCLENQRVVISAALTYEMDSGSPFSDGNNGVTLRSTLMDNEYIHGINAFECPVSGQKDYDDYVLTYDARGISGIRCTIVPDEHSLSWEPSGH
jgi:prepilin-type N-terminal cleavage/methylation domain-containing protein